MRVTIATALNTIGVPMAGRRDKQEQKIVLTDS
jgi:hypothetical protein